MSKRLFHILTAALGLALLAQARADAVKSYPLTCRIGTVNQVYIDYDRSFSYIDFHTSKGPASSGLQPGQCAFNDRAVKLTQAILCFKGVAIHLISFTGTTIDWGHSKIETSPRGEVIRRALYGPTTLMNFMVHFAKVAHGTGACLVIDKFGV